MKITDIIDPASDVVRSLGAYASDWVAPTVRLGVTGLSRAGKTVFITSLVRNLLAHGRLPFFSAQAEGRIRRVYLEPQPDDSVPRFRYEDHLARLAADPPEWPDGTRRISQLRMTFEFERSSSFRRMLAPAFGPGRLNLDIVDYPGEWLVDLALLERDFLTWSGETIAALDAPQRKQSAHEFLTFARSVDGDAVLDETFAQTGARLYTAFLEAERKAAPALPTLGPGRFLMPGDLEGSPLLTFFPMLPTMAKSRGMSSLSAQMERRFESYKAHVVKPFFRNHFSRIDRQIVLVDALSALNAGPSALADLSNSITDVLAAFRPGANTIASRLFSRRTDKIVFAATKADHLHHASHDRLEALLAALTARAINRASFAGAEIKTLAMATVRATREAEVQSNGTTLPCIIGTPMRGERVAGITFDGKTETALFPGDLPADPHVLITGAPLTEPKGADDVRVLRFQPPRLILNHPDGRQSSPPHIRMDRALEFLLGDKFL